MIGKGGGKIMSEQKPTTQSRIHRVAGVPAVIDDWDEWIAEEPTSSSVQNAFRKLVADGKYSKAIALATEAGWQKELIYCMAQRINAHKDYESLIKVLPELMASDSATAKIILRCICTNGGQKFIQSAYEQYKQYIR